MEIYDFSFLFFFIFLLLLLGMEEIYIKTIYKKCFQHKILMINIFKLTFKNISEIYIVKIENIKF